ncbi:hypothetical protein [Comamonas sp. 26]|uniref:hypothetical protein n=1 Tax=Comamonas sp. 26 TaxID=2035201 RepID=UPI0013046435|nr:hypothetical protein [Comamonas sp. 26]
MSPLIGAVMGLALTVMVQPADERSSPPKTVNETRIIFVHRIEVQRGTQDDGSWVFPIGIAAVLLLTWGYARYAEVGVAWWATFTLTFISFNAAAGIAAAIRGEFLGTWFAYIVFPLASLFVSLWLAASAKVQILPGAVEAATKHGFVNFYLNVLSPPQRHWLFTQAIGVLVGALATLWAAARLTHYVALSNQRGSGRWASLWRGVAWATNRTAGWPSLMFGIFFYALSGACIHGLAYEWLMHSPRLGG